MKRFQLCLLAVFMLLVSNCVAGSETVQLPDDQKETQVGTGKSGDEKKAAAPIGGETGVKTVAEGHSAAKPDITKNVPPQGDTQSGTAGAPGSATGISTPETQAGVETSHGAPVVGGAEKDQKTGGNPSESSPATEGDTKETKAKDDHSKSAPAAEDDRTKTETEGNPSHGAPVLGGDGKDQKKEGLTPQSAPVAEDTKTKTETGGKPSEGAPVVAGTTAAPAAEGKPTEGNSGSASTSTHIPTDPAKGADSQASVKAGVLSFILSIGSVLAVFA